MTTEGPSSNGGKAVEQAAPGLDQALTATTVRIDQDLPLVEVGARSGLLWSRERFTLAGMGEAARVTLDRPGGFASAAATMSSMAGESELDVAGTGPVAFAALAFDPDKPGQLIIPEVVLGASAAGQRWLTTIAPSGPAGNKPSPDPNTVPGPDRDAVTAALQMVERFLADGETAGRSEPEPVEYSLRSSLRPEEWRDGVVAAAVDRIVDGDLEKAVFARELVLQTDRPIPVVSVVQRLQAVFPSAALFLVDGFVGASPELLVARHDDVVRAHPLAGTASRSSDPAIDQRQIGGLLSSEKDRWEHRITIDWLLDTLLPFCSYVDAEPEPSIVTLANVHHLGTMVEGRLSSPAAPILELVAALHPTPAVGGSPQKEALAMIGELERTERGRYAGPTGWVDGAGNGQFAVAIRSAELGGTETRLFAGVGVVKDSDPQAELDETRAKFKAMLGALIVP